MNEKKNPKKPLIYYYVIVLVVVMILNATLFPKLMSATVKEVNYSEFVAMLDKGEIDEVILKTSMVETRIWTRATGLGFQSEQYGVYVKLERNDVDAVSMSYDGFSGGVSCADYTLIDSGEYFFMDNDIVMMSKDREAPIPFTITVKGTDGNTVASGDFSFDASMEKMYLKVTAGGEIIEEKGR